MTLLHGCSTHSVLVGGVKLECSESSSMVSRMGLLGCTFRDRGQDLAGFQGLQAACGGGEEHDTAIMARKGMARERTRAGGWGGNSRRDGQMPVPGPHVSPLPVVECTVNTLWRSTV